MAEGLTAASAAGGALGLVFGAIDLGATIDGRLPFESPVVGGVALAAAVALPMAVGAEASWRGRYRADRMAVGAGTALMGWIVVEVACIRSFSWLQPAFLLVGAGIVAAGARGLPRD